MIEEDGFLWEGTREELEAWKVYKQLKALAFVGRGYSVQWYPDADGWIDVFHPERHRVNQPELRAVVKFFSQPSQYGIDGGKVSKLTILESRTRLFDRAINVKNEDIRVLYNYDRGLDRDQLSQHPRAKTLYDAVIEELN